jgi:hypothetical protein
MKSLLLIGILSLSFEAQSFECSGPNNEAQFIGVVTDYNIKKCSYKIAFNRFNSSYVCPLSLEEVYDHTFFDESCSLYDGQNISGILLKNRTTQEITIE